MHSVLVVDDDPDIREALGDILEDEGYRVLRAENGERALDILRQRGPCVMLLDLMMPVMSGWEVIEAIHEDAHLEGTRIVVCSAMTAPGAHAWLQKPVSVLRLLEVVHAECGEGCGEDGKRSASLGEPRPH